MNMLQYPVKFLFPGAFSLSIMAGAGAAQFFTLLEGREAIQRYLKGFAVFFLLLLGVLVTGGFFKEQLFAYFQTVYPQTQYFQGIEKDSFFFMFKGLSLVVILFALFFIIGAAVLKGSLRISLSKQLVFIVILCDLAFIAKPDEPYVPESLFSRKISTINYFQKEVPPARTFSLYYVTNNRSFLHVYFVPFIMLYKTFQEVLLPNINMYYHIPTVDEYKELNLKTYHNVFSPVLGYFKAEKLSAAEKLYRDKILSLLNVKYIISTLPVKESNYKLIHDGPVKIYENPDCLPRAFFAEKLLLVESEKDVLKRMEDPSFDPQKMVFISNEEMGKLANTFIVDPKTDKKESFIGSVQFIDYQPNYMTLKTQANESRFLVLSENYYPGWRAWVNGREQPILRVDYTLRGLLLDKGTNEIRFVFKPQSFLLGAWITMLTLTCVVGSLLILRPKRYA